MTEQKLGNNLTFDLIRATEAAAIASHKMFGMGDEKAADGVAVDAMRAELRQININGTIVIGEGERDEAPMLYIGEKIGTGNGLEVDIAVDPLEGTTILATGKNNALSVIAAAECGKFLRAPDVYMDKIAIGFDFHEQIIDLDNSPEQNLKNIALAKKCEISDLVVSILDRERHQDLIAKVRAAGARIALIQDGDISAVISTAIKKTHIDVYMGVGGAPEGVLAAAALCTLGGQMASRLVFRNDEEKRRAINMGIKDLNKQYRLSDMAFGDVIFAATAVTPGSLIKKGVHFKNGKIITRSIAMRSSLKATYKLKTSIAI
ncbi:MAG: class II fructose-bisphosphatase [Rickettsiaceae bacterium]|nr:class II fructose-bisphosphatase [Rickettsiaceae bacterium]